MNHPIALPPLPITEAAQEVTYYERSEAFHPSGEIQLGNGFSDPATAALFSPPPHTLKIRNFKINEAYLDTASMLLFKDGHKIPETAHLLPSHHYENAQVLHNQLVELDPQFEYVIGCNLDRNYYHWLIQGVPPIDWAMRSKQNQSVSLLLPESNTWQASSLDLLGYGNIPRVTLTPYNRFYFPRVSYSEFLTGIMPDGISRAAQSTFQRFRSVVSDVLVPQAEIIYVARTDTARRVAINEPELIQVLVAEGVHVIVPGSLPFAQQIAFFVQASAVIAPHGAGLANIVVCKSGTILYEMLPEHYPNNCFSRLAQAGGLHYWAEMLPSHGEGNGHERNWIIDINVVKERLRKIRMRLAESYPTRVASAHSGDHERSIRSIMNTEPGDHEYALAVI